MANPYQNLYGLLAEFDTTDGLIAAANRLSQAGYRRIDAYTPFPVEGLAEEITSGVARPASSR